MAKEQTILVEHCGLCPLYRIGNIRACHGTTRDVQPCFSGLPANCPLLEGTITIKVKNIIGFLDHKSEVNETIP